MTPYELHKEKWSACTRCPLHETRRNVVLVRGKLPADVLFVGEAPGSSEDALGKPFIGPAGKLLDRIVEDAGGSVDRVRLAFTNVIACIPYGEDGKKVAEPALWPKEAIEYCNPRLKEIVRISRPPHIVLVGQVARKAVAGQAQFALPEEDGDPEWLKGKFMEFTEIVHPAAILRANPAQQGLMYQKCVIQLAEVFESLIPF